MFNLISTSTHEYRLESKAYRYVLWYIDLAGRIRLCTVPDLFCGSRLESSLKFRGMRGFFRQGGPGEERASFPILLSDYSHDLRLIDFRDLPEGTLLVPGD